MDRDGEIAGMLGAVEHFGNRKQILILTDSKAAISSVRKAGRKGKVENQEVEERCETGRWIWEGEGDILGSEGGP